MSSGGDDGLDPDKYTTDGSTGSLDDPDAVNVYGPYFPGAPKNLVATWIPRVISPALAAGERPVQPDPTLSDQPPQAAIGEFDPAVATGNRGKKVIDQTAPGDLQTKGCVTPTPGVTKSVTKPLVLPSIPPQAAIPPTLTTLLKTTGLYDRATSPSKFLWFRGEKLPTKFPVTHALIDTSGKDVLYGYRLGYRKEDPSACFVHTTAGTRTPDAMKVKAAFEKSLRDETKGAAHLIINPAGHVFQVFDLAKLVAHTAGHKGEYNLISVSVEFMVPGPAFSQDSFGRAVTQGYQQLIEAGPWPSLDNWRWLFSRDEDASKITSTSRGLKYAFAPTPAQKSTFLYIVDAFTSFGWFGVGAIPRPKDRPNTAVRTVDRDLALRWVRKKEWTYFHHAQVEPNRSDAGGLDLPEILGLL